MDEKAQAGVTENLRPGRIVGQADRALGKKRHGRRSRGGRLGRLFIAADGTIKDGGRQKDKGNSADSGDVKWDMEDLLCPSLLTEQKRKCK